MSKVLKILKNEIVLIISFVLAVISAFFVTPSLNYFGYIDFRTLALLFCLMTVVAGFNSLGVFELAAQRMLKKVRNTRQLAVIFTLLCFFSSMVITNDVALITFVPFTIIVLEKSDSDKLLIPIVVLETLAANLGSMLLPIGNPQNLYIFSYYNMSFADFISAILPYSALSLTILIVMCLFIKENKRRPENEEKTETHFNRSLVAVYSILFLLALLSVFRVMPYYITFAITVISILIFQRKLLLKADYSLLFTFVFLFIFIGNIGRIDAVSEFLGSIVCGNEVVTGVAASQVISNVPAAILLSGFTDNAKGLLIGTNLGGLGTLIASMASLISFRFIAKENVSTGKYILLFTVLNVFLLALNMVLWLIIK